MEPLPPSRITQLLDAAKFAHVAVVSGGDPYVSPLSFVRHEDVLYFRCTPGERVDALRERPRASVSVVEFDDATGAWESVLVRGDVHFIDDDLTEDAIVVLFLDKYRDYTSALGSGPRLHTFDDAGIGWIGTAEVAPGAAVLFGLDMREVSGRTSGRWMTPGTRPGRL
jgi:nitroimidazol reductase NimA-like FMN-containing flavoprotein (pyridoxamine 5'-phosphate oxidase superfamily)